MDPIVHHWLVSTDNILLYISMQNEVKVGFCFTHLRRKFMTAFFYCLLISYFFVFMAWVRVMTQFWGFLLQVSYRGWNWFQMRQVIQEISFPGIFLFSFRVKGRMTIVPCLILLWLVLRRKMVTEFGFPVCLGWKFEWILSRWFAFAWLSKSWRKCKSIKWPWICFPSFTSDNSLVQNCTKQKLMWLCGIWYGWQRCRMKRCTLQVLWFLARVFVLSMYTRLCSVAFFRDNLWCLLLNIVVQVSH